jgi:hypothetical protein
MRATTGSAARRPHNGRSRATAQERELMLAREAIALVASGASSRVVVAGIRFGAFIFDEAQRIGLDAGVRVAPVPRFADSGSDLIVEALSR